MNDRIKNILKPVGSLRITVVLLALAVVLIFCATWAQIDLGIWAVVNEYFRSLVVWVPIRIFLPRPAAGELARFPGFPLPGGYLLGAAFLVNLIAAHLLRFKLAWKRTGIFLIHTAIILLLVGEAITGNFAVEAQMPILEGRSSRWAQDIREVELAIRDPDKDVQNEVAIDHAMLKPETLLRHELLPFDIEIERYMSNCGVARRSPNDPEPAQASRGIALQWRVQRIPDVTGISKQNVNYPAAIVRLTHGGQSLGSYMVTPHLQGHDDVAVLEQPVQVEGKTYLISLRFRRYYKPYSVHLIDFKHDKYTGTTVPSNYSSEVQLVDPANHEDRKVLIYMNNPLRYRGETFFQASFLKGDIGTVLAIVDNPGWQLPYLACTLGAIGLLVHFGITLTRFLKRTAK